jgi:bifunctional non-homologous end joining protein LigD
VGFNQRRDEKLLVAQMELVAQIEFTEWTPDGHLRHSKFVGLREDKEAREIVREIERQL